jgi:polysaccharide deacetylase family protein (PEP-CTERM system associated)
MDSSALLLSIDLEDWHQLVRRRLGMSDWNRLGPELERQLQATFSLLDSLGARATFFVLGMVAADRPALVAEIAQRGHEIACHGHAHQPVHRQTRAEFADDLRAARGAIASATGRLPIGYRAPAFSITGAARGWAFEVLGEEGFGYDSSQSVSLSVRGHVGQQPLSPHQIELSSGRRLWELPVAACVLHRVAVPIGGASYWSLMPHSLVLRALRDAPEHAGLYLHPQELGPDPLRIGLPPGIDARRRAQAASRTARRELARRRTPAMLRAIAERFDLIPYGDFHARLNERTRAGTPAFSN